MCGIVGYVGAKPAVDVLISGLRRLEYRGYDSAGIALLMNSKIEIIKAEGRLENVENLVKAGPSGHYSSAKCGIGHTRWATHGKPTRTNAHPHRTGHIVLVHNGIIENYHEIAASLLKKGHRPVSETDSELFGYLVLEEMKLLKEGSQIKKGSLLQEAARRSFAHIQGQCSIIVMSDEEPGVLVALRSGAPLVATRDSDGGVVFASDPQPLISYSRSMYFIEPGEMAVGTTAGLEFFEIQSGKKLNPAATEVDWSEDKLNKGGFPHYMLKEIHDQPSVIIDTLNTLVDRTHASPFRLVGQPGVDLLDKAQALVLVACGTSWHAALLGKYWIEKFAKIPVSVELASEFRYRDPVLPPGTLVIGLSQSGETADTLAALREMKARGVPCLAITNVRGSSLSRVADATFYTLAGPEIGVAATKTFVAQLLVLYLFAGHRASQLAVPGRSHPEKELSDVFNDLLKIPHILAQQLDESNIHAIQKTVEGLKKAKGFFFIGRGFAYPIALEGALKLKETAYDYAEGYAAGELKHGPIAMIDEGMVVVVIAPPDSWREKTVSNLQEVKVRGAIIVGIGATGDQHLRQLCDFWLPLPKEVDQVSSGLLPFLTTPIVQLLSYYRSVGKGTDIDKPRNLAKSVTVE